MPFVWLTGAELDAYGVDSRQLAIRFTLSSTDKSRLSDFLAHTGFDFRDEVVCTYTVGSFLLWQ